MLSKIDKFLKEMQEFPEHFEQDTCCFQHKETKVKVWTYDGFFDYRFFNEKYNPKNKFNLWQKIRFARAYKKWQGKTTLLPLPTSKL